VAHPAEIVEQGDRENKAPDTHQPEEAIMDVKPKPGFFQSLKTLGPAGWTAIFTGVLVVFTCLEWNVSSKTSDIQRSSERAFLTFNGPTIGARLVGGQNAANTNAAWGGQEVGMVWNNNGETPARNVTIKLGANAFSPDIPEQFDYPLGDKIPVVVGAKAGYGTNIQIPRDVIIDGFNSKKRIFVWGDALYNDVFDDSPRLSEFCVELTHLTFVPMPTSPSPPTPTVQQTSGVAPSAVAPNATPLANAPVDFNSGQFQWVGFQWQQCRSHNCYDKDCPDYKERLDDMNKKTPEPFNR
jgi:hypothetical protein